MVYKRYVRRNGKVFGPYYYESYREGNTVKKRYIGGEKKPLSLDFNSLLRAFLVVVFVFLMFFMLYNYYGISSRITLQYEPEFKEGQILEGKLRLAISEGEFIPEDSLVVVDFGNYSVSKKVGEVFDIALENGSYYVAGTAISGSGNGYGKKGSRAVYPDVSFKLRIVQETEGIAGGSESSEDNPEQPVNQVSDNESLGRTKQGQEEAAGKGEETGEEIVGEEQVAVEESGDEITITEDEAISSVNEGGVTGSAVSENEFIVEGKVRKGEEYNYNLEEGQTVGLVSGSVEANGEQIGDDKIRVEITRKKVIVSSDYSRVDEGFGEEYLSEKKYNFESDLSKLEVPYNSGVVRIRLVYGNEVLAAFQRNVGEAGISSVNISLKQEISAVRIVKNSFAKIYLGDYFENAGSYELICENISAGFSGDFISIKPDEGFIGMRKCEIIAWAGDKNVSAWFNVFVSSGKLEIKTDKVGQIKVGEKVKWTANVTLENPETMTIEIPVQAENVSVKKLENGEIKEAQATISASAVYGQKSGGDGLMRLFRLLGITGRAVDGQNESSIEVKEVVLEDNATDYVIEYETPAPVAVEEETSYGKKVVVSGPTELNYTDILSFAEVPERIKTEQKDKIKVYWVENNSNVEFEAYDLNENGIVDYIEWITPHLSNQQSRFH